jgi:hypothetical protein
MLSAAIYFIGRLILPTKMKLVEPPEPQAAINDVVVQVHASGFTSGVLTWPSTWTDRLDRDRTPDQPST